MNTPVEIPAPLLSVGQVCLLLNISRTTLWKLRRQGHIPTVEIGRALRFRRADVERLMAGSIDLRGPSSAAPAQAALSAL